MLIVLLFDILYWYDR